LFLPIGDEPNPKGTPWVNYGLMAVNAVVFFLVTLPLMDQAPDPNDPYLQDLLSDLLAQNPGASIEEVMRAALGQATSYDLFLMRWGFRPADPSFVTLVSSMFLHGGWMHLLGNMLFLWIYGDNVEHRLGRAGYLAGYLLTGMLAAALYGLFAPEGAGDTPMVGASGAISGVLGFYFIWFPRNKVRILVVIIVFFDVWHINARLVLGFYLLVENLLPFLFADQSGGGVAYGAHIGGFVAGLGGALLLNMWFDYRCRRTVQDLGQQQGPPADAGAALDGTAETVSQLMARDQPARALQLLTALPPSERARVPVYVAARLADWVAASGNADAALAIYGRLRVDHASSEHMDRILLGIGLTLLHHKGRPTAAYQYLLDLLDAGPSADIEAAARQGLGEIARVQKYRLRNKDKESP